MLILYRHHILKSFLNFDTFQAIQRRYQLLSKRSPWIYRALKERWRLICELRAGRIVFRDFFRLISNRAAITIEFPAEPVYFSDLIFVSFVFSSHPIFDGEGGWKIEGGTGWLTARAWGGWLRVLAANTKYL